MVVFVPEAGSEGAGEFRCGLLPCNFDKSSRVIVSSNFWDDIVRVDPRGQIHCAKKWGPCSQTWRRSSYIYMCVCTLLLLGIPPKLICM